MTDANELVPNDRLVYHYTKAPTALEHILQTMTIRLGPIGDTNDPWEGRKQRIWVATGPEGSGAEDREPEGPSVHPAASHALDLALGRARVACFCRDDEAALRDPERARTRAWSSCGWARDRMWAQYADGHRGVCLCFDREKLLASFRSDLGDHGECLADDVVYDDEQYDRTPSLDAAEIVGPAEYARQYRAQHARARYFSKRSDWAGEREWRMVLFDDRPTGDYAFLEIPAGALRFIVVGHRFSDAYRPCVRAICERTGSHAYRFLYSGRPTLLSSRFDLESVRPA